MIMDIEYPDYCYCSSNGECRHCVGLCEMIELGELQMLLEDKQSSLEVEVDLFGSHTQMAHDLRDGIISLQKEMEERK